MCSHGMSGNLWRPGIDFRDLFLLQLFNDFQNLETILCINIALVLSVNYYVSIHAKVSL